VSEFQVGFLQLADTQTPISCDELLRKSLIKILTTPTLYEIFQRPPNELEEYFVEMVLRNNQFETADETPNSDDKNSV
jgi:hypothetical protein